MLSGEEIESRLGNNIIIYPFDQEKLRGASYNLSVGDFAWLHESSSTASRKRQIDDKMPIAKLKGNSPLGQPGEYFVIPPNTSVSVYTQETIYVDSSIAGLFCSKVDMVSKGFSHISTTLDPEWIGPLLINIRNASVQPVQLWVGETFVTLTFFKLKKPTKIRAVNPAGRADILLHMGFKFPETDADYLGKQYRYDINSLRKAFWASQEGKALKSKRSRAPLVRVGLLIVAIFLFLFALSMPFWFQSIFGLEPGSEAIVNMFGIAVAVFALILGFAGIRQGN